MDKIIVKDPLEGYITVREEYYNEITKKAEAADFYRGKALGMEYVIDTLADALKGWRSES